MRKQERNLYKVTKYGSVKQSELCFIKKMGAFLWAIGMVLLGKILWESLEFEYGWFTKAGRNATLGCWAWGRSKEKHDWYSTYILKRDCIKHQLCISKMYPCYTILQSVHVLFCTTCCTHMFCLDSTQNNISLYVSTRNNKPLPILIPKHIESFLNG